MKRSKIEIWVKIKGFSYFVSNFGRIKNKRGKILKPNINHGYLRAHLFKNNKYYDKRIHRLVLEAFDRVQKDLDINHIDGNKMNNNLDNLEYCTKKENMTHAWDLGLCRKYLGEECSTSKLTEKQVIEIKKQLKQGIRNKIIAKQFNVDPSLISHIKRGFVWSHINA